MMRLDADRFGRNMRLAGMTSASTARLTAAQSRAEDAALPAKAAIDNAVNHILAGLLDFSTNIVKGIESMPVVEALLKWLNMEQNPPRDNEIFRGLLGDIVRNKRGTGRYAEPINGKGGK